jgi:hypothetical protein
MLSQKTRSFLKDMLFVSVCFAVLSGAYFGFAVAERYRALTQAYLRQAAQIEQILSNAQGVPNAQESKP